MSEYLPTLRQSLSLLRQVASKYEDTVVRDPELTSKLEYALRIASYIIPGAHYFENTYKAITILPLDHTQVDLGARGSFQSLVSGCLASPVSLECIFFLYATAYSISNLYALSNDYIIARKCPASCKISKVHS